MDKCTELLNTFLDLTKKPEIFLGNEEITGKYETFLKTSYDTTKQAELASLTTNALPELITANFDTEQIWQQIELQNDGFLTHSLIGVSKFVVGKNKLIFHELEDTKVNNIEDEPEKDNNQEEEQQMRETDESSDDDDNDPLNLEEDSDEGGLNSDDLVEDENNEQDAEEQERPKKKHKPSIVDDKFFKLNEMEEFLQAEEKKLADDEPDSGNDSEADSNEDDEEDEDMDLFSNSNALEKTDTERGGINNPKYNDFFREQVDEKPGSSGRNRNKFLEEFDNEEDDDNAEEENIEDDEENEDKNIDETPEVKSTLEQREERLKHKIASMEDAAVGEKQWQLKGEIRAEDRPANSLLEEVVEFDLTTRPAPVVTEQVSLQLEDIIRQRIKDKAFDSVQRKEKPVETPLEFKKKLVLDQEKSKQSLAQIYEKEYLETLEKLDPDAEDKDEEEPALHSEIKQMMHGLFTKLDALSNFHFTPKPVQAEMKIVSNLPAINMEEVAPVATSDAALLAPEEIKAKVRGDIIGKSERTSTDKKRERRKKKAKQHHHALLKEANLGLGNKYSKAKAQQMLEQVTKSHNVDKMDETVGNKSVKSSTAFFTQLEQEVKSQIKSKHVVKKVAKARVDAKKLKL